METVVRGLQLEISYARHIRRCLAGEEEGGWEVRGKVRESDLCIRVASATNFARHQDGCRVWDPGGGRPWIGEL